MSNWRKQKLYRKKATKKRRIVQFCCLLLSCRQYAFYISCGSYKSRENFHTKHPAVQIRRVWGIGKNSKKEGMQKKKLVVMAVDRIRVTFCLLKSETIIYRWVDNWLLNGNIHGGMYNKTTYVFRFAISRSHDPIRNRLNHVFLCVYYIFQVSALLHHTYMR